MSDAHRRALYLREIGIDPQWVPRLVDGDAGRAIGLNADTPAGIAHAPMAPLVPPTPLSVAKPASVKHVMPANAPLPVAGAEATLEWQPLREMVSGCTRCPLCESRTQTVFGAGEPQADWLLIGEMPDESDEQQGEPLAGEPGRLFDNMLKSIGLRRGHSVCIANVVKCRPPSGRDPRPEELAACEPYLLRQIELIRPKLIVVMGHSAAQRLLRSEAGIDPLRGRVHAYAGVPVIVTHHPAHLLRVQSDKARAWEDLCLALDTMHAQGNQPSA